jgi:hypothetical protein
MSSTTQPTDYLSKLKDLDEDFQSYIIMAFIFIILIIFIGYMIYLSKLDNRECDYMNTLYSTVNGNIRPISNNDPDCTYNLFDYYIKTAYNACSGGSYKNDFVNLCNLKAVIKEGVRCLDFEIYSVDSNPVVSTSTTDDYYVKETFNSVNFASVMDTINNYAFSGGTCPNPTDPLIIHLRIKSNIQDVYKNLAVIFKSYDNIMLGKEYSFENSGKNLGNTSLLTFKNKVILIVDRINNSFLESLEFLEYVNLTSNSIFTRAYDYYGIKNNPDTQELTDYNRKSMTIVFPDKGVNPPNPSGALCRAFGCQMIAMRYQFVDNLLMENALFFDRSGYAFSLKPEELRYIPVTIPTPTPQNPAYSYSTREANTDFYSLKF